MTSRTGVRRLAPAFLAVAVVASGVGAALTIGRPAPSPTAGGQAVVPRFVDETATAGVEHAYSGEFTFFVGGGVAVFDCDDDGRSDLFIAGGSGRSALFRNESPVGGALRFAVRPDAATDLAAVVGAYPIDIDGDRLLDLAVLRLGENVILRGRGDCRFERANERWGIDGGTDWTAAFSATWESPTSRPTLAFGNYLALDAAGEPGLECADSALLRPDPDGVSYAPPVALSPGYCTLSILFSDWSRTGARDLRMSNDRHYHRDGEEQLWRVSSGAPPRLYTRDDGWQPVRIWGMGIASQDITGDGLPEVYLTSQGDNKLQTLSDRSGQPRYVDIALRRGATAHRPVVGDTKLPSTAWHAEFQDVNNDGLADLFVAKGNVDAMADYAALDPSSLLIGQPDGTFAESAEAAGILSFARARGAALADLNLDGLLDLVVVNRRENVKLWRGVGAGTAQQPVPLGSWVGLRLRQAGANADAIGAWVEVRTAGRTDVRELVIGGGHAGGQLGWTHVGLGDATSAEVRVTWPDGEIGPWQAVGADGFVTIERGAAPAPWVPASAGAEG